MSFVVAAGLYLDLILRPTGNIILCVEAIFCCEMAIVSHLSYHRPWVMGKYTHSLHAKCI